MVTDQQVQHPDQMTGLLAAIRMGLESLTITGPSAILESVYREALLAVTRRPSVEERELSINQAWLAAATSAHSIRRGRVSAPELASANQCVEEMYNQLRAAVSASRL